MRRTCLLTTAAVLSLMALKPSAAEARVRAVVGPRGGVAVVSRPSVVMPVSPAYSTSDVAMPSAYVYPSVAYPYAWQMSLHNHSRGLYVSPHGVVRWR